MSHRWCTIKYATGGSYRSTVIVVGPFPSSPSTKWITKTTIINTTGTALDESENADCTLENTRSILFSTSCN